MRCGAEKREYVCEYKGRRVNVGSYEEERRWFWVLGLNFNTKFYKADLMVVASIRGFTAEKALEAFRKTM